MLQVIRTRNKELMDVQSRFLSTTLQIWCYCGHVIKSRTMRDLSFDCQLNLSKSHKVWSSYLVSFRRSVEKFGWGGGEKRPPPCEIGLSPFICIADEALIQTVPPQQHSCIA